MFFYLQSNVFNIYDKNEAPLCNLLLFRSRVCWIYSTTRESLNQTWLGEKKQWRWSLA